MNQFIIVGCDLHDVGLKLKIAVDQGPVVTRDWANKAAGRAKMIADLQRRAAAAGGAKVVLAYEASGSGFGLYDELTAAGIDCRVLAPSRMEKSPKHQRSKTDDRDAQDLLERLRGHLLAGNELPSVWVPDHQTRDDRELMRVRQDLADKKTRIKVQIRWLLKRQGIEESPAEPWTGDYYAWLGELSQSRLRAGAAAGLSSLVRQLEAVEEEIVRLDGSVRKLSEEPRYRAAAEALCELKGVGVLTAMVYLTELGDLRRFANRYQVGAFLGLVPDSRESGPGKERKGHITRQGSGRVRKVLNQAVWSRVGEGRPDHGKYRRLVARNPKHKKIAVVALMRQLGVSMWHRALRATAA